MRRVRGRHDGHAPPSQLAMRTSHGYPESLGSWIISTSSAATSAFSFHASLEIGHVQCFADLKVFAEGQVTVRLDDDLIVD